MSFAYLPLYTGDYLRDTQHLTCSEHGIYIKLLMHCWDQRGPAPLDERKLCGIVNARSGDELEALRRVLAEFFVRMEDGHYNHRMQREIERCAAISVKREDAGRRGANERMRRWREAQVSAKQVPSNCQANAKQVTLSPSPSLTSIHTTEVVERGVQRGEIAPARKRAVAPSCPDDVEQQVWSDWLALRKAKKAPVTATVVRSAIAEAAKAGMTLESFLRVWCARGSQGLQADWLKPHERGGNGAEPAWRVEQRERMQQFAPFSHAKRPPAAEPSEIINANAKRLD